MEAIGSRLQQTTSTPSSSPDAKPHRRRPSLAKLIDGFAWPLRASHYVGLASPLWSTHSLEARVERIIRETAEARTLILRPGRSWRRHLAGQYVHVGVDIDGVRHTRSYSISSAPEQNDGRVAITVKAVPSGRVSQLLVHRLERGTYLTLSRPQGEFVLPEATPRSILFLTAGSGITPVMSMLRSLESRGVTADIVHLHYAPSAEEVIFGGELTRRAARRPRYELKLLYTRQQHASPTRHFNAEHLDGLCPDWRERAAYACGPQSLLDSTETHWEHAGIRARLAVERFRPTLAKPPENATGGIVRFTASERSCDADAATSLLAIAERAGLNPPSGCRMGICHTCTTTMRSGCVRDLRTNQLIDEPGSRVQLCVCAAAGDVELAL